MPQKKIWKTPAGSAALAALISGVIVHLFGLVNTLHNYDDVFSAPFGYGSGIESGRFMLTFLGELAGFFRSNYSLPVVNGLLWIVLMALSVYLVISTLRIQSRTHASLIGVLFAAFPTAASTLIHRFTAVYYGVGLLLAVLAAWVLYRNKYGLLISAIFTALSLGVYQAFAPITITLFVLQLLQQALEGKSDGLSIVKRGLFDCAALILGVVFYFLILKMTLAVTGIALLDYQGIDSMGHISLRELPMTLVNAAYLFCTMPLRDYCGLTCTPFLKVCYVLLGGLSIGMIGYILLTKIRRVDLGVITLLLCAVFPIAVNFVYVMCPDGAIYTLMVYSFALIACVPVIVCQCLPPSTGERRQKLLARTVAVLIAMLSAGYAYMDNVNYSVIYYCNRQVENYLTAFIAQVRMTEGFDTEKEWAILGDFEDPLFWFDWESGLTYGGFTGPKNNINSHARQGWLRNYLGYGPRMASEERRAQLANMPEVQEMPCWPNDGSIRIIGDTIVIKCQNVPDP